MGQFDRIFADRLGIGCTCHNILDLCTVATVSVGSRLTILVDHRDHDFLRLSAWFISCEAFLKAVWF